MNIEPHSWRSVVEHAIETYPEECCGVLVAGPDGTLEVFKVRNIQNEMHARDPRRYPRDARIAYTGHPADLKQALESAERRGFRLAGFYHSHPDHAAYFSEEDILQATPFGEPSYPEALQIVLSVVAGQVMDTKAYAWSNDKQTYVETALTTG